MANKDARFGFKPVRYLNGTPWNGMATRYCIPATDGTAVYIGDLVNLAGTAQADDGTPDVTRATLADGNYTIGPVVAVEPETNASLVYRAASTKRYVYVADDPNLIFHVQAEGTPTTTMSGLNAIGIDTHSGSTVTGLSGTELDMGTGTAPAADSSYMFFILGGAKIQDNDWDAEHGILEVIISMHRFMSGVATVGRALGA